MVAAAGFSIATDIRRTTTYVSLELSGTTIIKAAMPQVILVKNAPDIPQKEQQLNTPISLVNIYIYIYIYIYIHLIITSIYIALSKNNTDVIQLFHHKSLNAMLNNCSLSRRRKAGNVSTSRTFD